MHALLRKTSDIDLFVHAEELYDIRDSDERLETELVRIDGSKPTGEKITIALRYAKSADQAGANGHDVTLDEQAYIQLAKRGRIKMGYSGENEIILSVV